MEQLPQCADNAIKNLTDAPTKSIGNLIKDAIYLKFGSVSYNAEKRRILEKYGLTHLFMLALIDDSDEHFNIRYRTFLYLICLFDINIAYLIYILHDIFFHFGCYCNCDNSRSYYRY